MKAELLKVSQKLEFFMKISRNKTSKYQSISIAQIHRTWMAGIKP